MPIQIDTKQMPLTPADACNILQTETDTFGTFLNLDRILYHEARYAREAAKYYPEWRAMSGWGGLNVTQRTEVRNILMKRFGVPEYKLTDARGDVNLREETVANLLLDPTLSEDAHHYLELYKKISAADYMISYLSQYRRLPMSRVEDMDNQRMVVAHPTWSVLATSRISAKEPSVQNIKRDICDIYTAPKGWQMVFSDSGQIEPRITYSAFIRDELIVKLITMYDDAYYGLLHYITMSAADEAYYRNHLDELKCHDVTEEMSAKRQRLKVLGLAGNYGSTDLAAIDRELGPLYEQKLVNHPARRTLEGSVRTAVKEGADRFYGYFGTEIVPPSNAKYVRGGSGWANHLIRCGINNPIQTTAAELMCFSVYHAKKLLGPNDHIGAYKHDEGMFYVREDHVDELAPKLRECLAYEVNGWIPIGSDLLVGRKKSPHAPDIF